MIRGCFEMKMIVNLEKSQTGTSICNVLFFRIIGAHNFLQVCEDNVLYEAYRWCKKDGMDVCVFGELSKKVRDL